jgi:hypothetical protein
MLVVIDVKLYRDDGPRRELALADFDLRDDFRRLMARLDAAKNGMIQLIDVRAGLPRRVLLEARLTGSLLMDAALANARSPNVATQSVDIRITNQRSNASKIYWLNRQGQRVFYMTLESGAFYTQPTYSEHPWVVTDSDEHCTMFFVATTAPHQEVTIRAGRKD